jgi:hypothetical protein
MVHPAPGTSNLNANSNIGSSESPTWIPANRKVAKYARKGVNPKKIFD